MGRVGAQLLRYLKWPVGSFELVKGMRAWQLKKPVQAPWVRMFLWLVFNKTFIFSLRIVGKRENQLKGRISSICHGIYMYIPTGRKAQPNPRARDFLSAVPVLIRYTHIFVFCYLLRATIFGWIRVALGLALIPSEFHFLGFQSCVQASSIYCGNEVF